MEGKGGEGGGGRTIIVDWLLKNMKQKKEKEYKTEEEEQIQKIVVKNMKL